MKQRPLPSKTCVLSRLKRHVPITSIVDVGVREHTCELIESFPDKKHYLFEPVSHFFDSITKHYQKIDFQLYPLALSDRSSQIYLVLSSLQDDGEVTHSSISETPIEPDGRHVISCRPVEVKRFDALDIACHIEADFLLKVDVDGKELEVLNGFGDRLTGASVVIVECTFQSALPRMAFLLSKGFSLVDMVDIVYYGDSLYQFDAVLVREDLVTPALRPPIGNYKHDIWQPLELSRLPRFFWRLFSRNAA